MIYLEIVYAQKDEMLENIFINLYFAG